MSAIVLILTTFLLLNLFLLGQNRAIRADGASRAQIKKHLLQSVLIVFAIMAFDLVAGFSGMISSFNRFPPPAFPFLLISFAIVFILARSKFGTLLAKHCTYSQLVGYQAFRVLAELTLFLGLKEGLTPKQLTFEGYNFDIVTALSAIALALYSRKKADRNLIVAWNLMGLGFLAIILFIALTSMPVPFRVFMNEPSNTWVTRDFYPLLPGFVVPAAIFGHLVLFKKLRMRTHQK